MTINYEVARIRNLKIKISHASLENESLSFHEGLSDEELKHNFYFKERDIKLLKGLKSEGNPSVYSSISDDVNVFIKEHKGISRDEIDELETTLKNNYLIMKSRFESFKVDNEFIEEKLTQLTEVSRKLHWYYLPIYNEEFMINRDIIPEINLSEYYNHFHSIEDLYRHIFEPTKAIDWKSIGGDLNLGYKLDFKVYTCRWGHYDNYSFIRMYNGWNISAMTNFVECGPDGVAINNTNSSNGSLIKSGLYYILNHDSIQYPEDGVKYSLYELWKEADANEMSSEELQEKLNDIANWISEVEKATHEHQPSWCRYY